MDDENGRLKDEAAEKIRKRRNDDSELVPHEGVRKQVRDDSCEKSEKRLISMKKCSTSAITRPYAQRGICTVLSAIRTVRRASVTGFDPSERSAWGTR